MVGIASHSLIFAVQNPFPTYKILIRRNTCCALHCIAGVFLYILAFLITHLCSFRRARKELSLFGGLYITTEVDWQIGANEPGCYEEKIRSRGRGTSVH